MKLIRGMVATAVVAAGVGVAPTAQAGSAYDSFQANNVSYVQQLVQPMSCITRRGTIDGSSPMFYGCMDWHSSVHGHWGNYAASAITGNSSYAARATANMPASKFASEMSYMDRRASTRYSDRTYGYAWLLKLAIDREKSTGNKDFRRVADKAANDLAAGLSGQAATNSEYTNASWAALRLHDYAVFTGNATLKQEAADAVASTVRGYNCSAANDVSTGFFPRCWMKLAAIAEVEGPAAADYLRSQTSGVRYNFIPNNPRSHMNGLNFYAAYAIAKVASVTQDDALKENAASLINQQVNSPRGWRDDYMDSHWVPQAGTLAIQALRDVNSGSASPIASATPVRTSAPTSSVPPTAPVATQQPSATPTPTKSWSVPATAPVATQAPSLDPGDIEIDVDEEPPAPPAPVVQPAPVHPFVAWLRQIFRWPW